jgi:REP element-mobilizing transposase RayT
MARAWRIEFEGSLYHVLSRGNEKRDIFFGDDDRRLFLDTLGEMAQRFEIDVFVYVLMDNHYHLLLCTPRANLSRAMQWLGVTYTNRFNARHSRSGHLFQGRFKNMLVQNDAYLLQLSYYIHRNPLRAKMVERLADYRWSSYRAYAYGQQAPEWLDTERILSQLVNAKDRHKAYRENTQKYAREEGRLWEDLRHGFILGEKRFVSEIKKRFLPEIAHREIPQQRWLTKEVDLNQIISKAAAFLGCDVEEFRRSARVSSRCVFDRDLLLYAIWQLGARTNSQIGEIFGLSGSAVSKRVAVLKSKAADDKLIREKLTEIKSLIQI